MIFYRFDPIKVAQAVQNGLSHVCALCSKYWKARDLGVPGDQCLSVDKCGSPLVGDDFHEYEGPLNVFERWCFVCGEKSKYGVKAKNRPRILGVCADHIRFFSNLDAVPHAGIPKVDIRDEQSRSKSIQDILGPPPKSLIKAIMDTEAEMEADRLKKG
jgi:hypothetical protein